MLKCEGMGHLQADCPNHRAIMYIGGQLMEIDSVKEEHEDNKPEDDDVEEIGSDEGELLVINKACMWTSRNKNHGSEIHSSTLDALPMARCVM